MFRNSWLFLRTPREKVVPQKYTRARSGPSGINTAGPISISKGSEVERVLSREKQTLSRSRFDILQKMMSSTYTSKMTKEFPEPMVKKIKVRLDTRKVPLKTGS